MSDLPDFQKLRHDPKHHLGLGDVRITVAQQNAIEQRIAELEENLHYTKGCCDLAMKHRDIAEARLKTCLGNCAVHERNETAAIEKHFALLERLEGLMREDWVPAKLAAIIREARDE